MIILLGLALSKNTHNCLDLVLSCPFVNLVNLVCCVWWLNFCNINLGAFDSRELVDVMDCVLCFGNMIGYYQTVHYFDLEAYAIIL